jgi:dTDP-4-dehydrorhamnose reductase
MRIAVTGLNGQVVSTMLELDKVSGHDIIAVGRPDLDLLKIETIYPALSQAAPDVIVSAAAYTAVDKAEMEFDQAHRVNALGAGAVAAAAKSLNVPVIHLSTDFVFDGTKKTGLLETDRTLPISVYGSTKLLGEQLVARSNSNSVIVRVAWVYSPIGNNFVKTMLRLSESRDEVGVVDDQIGTPTSAFDIAVSIIRIAERIKADNASNLRGIFHLSPEGFVSWADFADAIFSGAAARGKKTCHVRRITTAEYPTAAKRPAYSRLKADKISDVFGIKLNHWKMGLDSCLDRLIGPVK